MCVECLLFQVLRTLAPGSESGPTCVTVATKKKKLSFSFSTVSFNGSVADMPVFAIKLLIAGEIETALGAAEAPARMLTAGCEFLQECSPCRGQGRLLQVSLSHLARTNSRQTTTMPGFSSWDRTALSSRAAMQVCVCDGDGQSYRLACLETARTRKFEMSADIRWAGQTWNCSLCGGERLVKTNLNAVHFFTSRLGSLTLPLPCTAGFKRPRCLSDCVVRETA